MSYFIKNVSDITISKENVEKSSIIFKHINETIPGMFELQKDGSIITYPVSFNLNDATELVLDYMVKCSNEKFIELEDENNQRYRKVWSEKQQKIVEIYPEIIWKNPDDEIINAEFTSIYNDGSSVTTPCTIDLSTHKITSILAPTELPCAELEEEYVTIDGDEYPALSSDDIVPDDIDRTKVYFY